MGCVFSCHSSLFSILRLGSDGMEARLTSQPLGSRTGSEMLHGERNIWS